MESHCPVGEKDWHAIDKHFKGKIIKDIRDRFVIPPGAEYDNQALKNAKKCWKQFKYSLKLIYYKPLEKKLDDIYNNVQHGIASSNWDKLTMSACSKKARASQNQIHTSGSKSFANQQADYDDVKAKVELLRMMHPKISEKELEDEAFQKTMYRDEVPDRPVGYGLEV
uniref:Transposase n=1 Tax=Chenopodium quinoa TaxID=63459 RepID=A0A803NAB5_CHEQI